MPFNYYDIVTVLTIGVLILAAFFFVTRNVRALWILAVACIPFSSEVVVEIPIQGTSLPMLFFPTDFLAGIISAFIALSIPIIKQKLLLSEIRQSRIFLFIVFYLFWMFIATLFSTNFIPSAKFLILQLAHILSYGLVGYYVISQNIEEVNLTYRRYLIGPLLATFFICIVEHIILGPNREMVSRAIMPFFREHTVYGAFSAWMFSAYFIFWRNNRLSLTLLVALLFSAMALYLSYSRGGWLSAVGALGLLPVLGWLWRLGRRKALAVMMGLAILSAAGLWFLINNAQVWLEDTLHSFLGDTGQRIASSFDTQRDVSNVGRIHRWIVAWEMFKYQPITGIGPGAFPEEYHTYKASSQLYMAIKKSDLAYAGIHSEYITALTEMGIFGFVFLVMIYGLTLYYPFYYAFSAKDKRDRIVGILVAVPLLSYYLHAVINNFMDHGKIAALIYLHWGAAMALEVAIKKKQSNRQAEYALRSYG